MLLPSARSSGVLIQQAFHTQNLFVANFQQDFSHQKQKHSFTRHSSKMMSGNKGGSILAIILGGACGVTIIAWLTKYYLWPALFGNKKTIKDDPKNKNDSSEVSHVLKAPKFTEEVSIEDAEDDESEDEEDSDEDDDEEHEEDSESDEEGEVSEEKQKSNEAEEAFLLIKSKYDDANRLAAKLIAGQSYERAAEKLTEAIELAATISVSNKDVTTLYNNRSAMFEKMGEFEKSLQDILIVLTMDVNHVKARTRRGRIYEAQVRK